MNESIKKNGKLLQVAQLGCSILRKKSKQVKDIKDPIIQELIDDLMATVMDVDGVGIAAPQVYRPLRIFILASHPNPRYPNAPDMKPTAIINPIILSYSKDKTKDWEGCLSIPGIRALVPRNKMISVEYINRKGEKITGEFKGFIAKIFLHEYDHLEGMLFIDRVESTKDIVTEKEYQRIIKKKVINK